MRGAEARTFFEPDRSPWNPVRLMVTDHAPTSRPLLNVKRAVIIGPMCQGGPDRVLTTEQPSAITDDPIEVDGLGRSVVCSHHRVERFSACLG